VLLLLALLVISPVIFLYFLVIKGMDRYEPEPFWLLTVMFFWGAVVATATAVVGNAIGEGALGWALDAERGDPLLRASTASFVAPLVEESTKGFGLIVLWGLSAAWLREHDGPLDGAIYGGVIGLGFTMTEDALYVASAGAQQGAAGFTGLFFVRTVLAGLGHASFTAMTGVGIGVAAESRSGLIKLIAPIGGWMAAVGLHFLHNFLVTFALGGGIGLLLKLFVFWTFQVIFFFVILALAVRDRAIVLRGLVDEAGQLLHPKELKRTTSYWMLVPFVNLFALMSSPGGYSRSRKKQLDLVELAFLKHRFRQGVRSAKLEHQEQELRSRIGRANQDGVFIGAR
jgi:RsiW-degrading membrane proteinase PrsW (M82 family)